MRPARRLSGGEDFKVRGSTERMLQSHINRTHARFWFRHEALESMTRILGVLSREREWQLAAGF